MARDADGKDAFKYGMKHTLNSEPGFTGFAEFRDCDEGVPNENYAPEVIQLFTSGWTGSARTAPSA